MEHAGDQPDLSIALTVPTTLALDALAGDLANDISLGDSASSFTEKISPIFDDPMDPILSSELSAGGVAGGLSRLPRTMDPNSPYNPGNKRGSTGRREPFGYPGQDF